MSNETKKYIVKSGKLYRAGKKYEKGNTVDLYPDEAKRLVNCVEEFDRPASSSEPKSYKTYDDQVKKSKSEFKNKKDYKE